MHTYIRVVFKKKRVYSEAGYYASRDVRMFKLGAHVYKVSPHFTQIFYICSTKIQYAINTQKQEISEVYAIPKLT